MGDRDDTSYVQGLLDRGEPVPPGEWWCPGGVTLPAGYPQRAAEAAEGEPALTSGPGFLRIGDAVINWRGPVGGVVTVARVSGEPRASDSVGGGGGEAEFLIDDSGRNVGVLAWRPPPPPGAREADS